MNAAVITRTATEAEVFSPCTRAAQMSESKTMAIAALAEKLRREGVNVIDLGAGEPDFPTPPNIRRAAYAAMEGGQTKYTATSGTADFKQALRDRFAQDFGSRYETAEVMAASGAKQVIFNAISTLIEPGDEVLIAKPYWVTFPEAVTFAGGRTVWIETEDQGFRVTADAVTPGEAFGAPGYLRVSYANSLSNLKEAVTRLQLLLEGN